MNRVLVILFVAGLLSSCGGGDATGRATGVAALTGDLARGELAYASACTSCHGATGQGTAAGRAIAAEFRSKSAVELATYVLNGVGKMPSQANLTDQQIADIIVFGKTLK